MAYTIDLADAARRHQQAAECLHECEPSCRRRDVAGYLYGLAAECALKQIFLLSYRGRPPENKKEDPLYAHFPELKTMLRDGAQGRHAEILRRFAEDDAFMNEWDIAMRYAPKRDIPDRLVERWRAQTQLVMSKMEERL